MCFKSPFKGIYKGFWLILQLVVLKHKNVQKTFNEIDSKFLKTLFENDTYGMLHVVQLFWKSFVRENLFWRFSSFSEKICAYCTNNSEEGFDDCFWDFSKKLLKMLFDKRFRITSLLYGDIVWILLKDFLFPAEHREQISQWYIYLYLVEWNSDVKIMDWDFFMQFILPNSLRQYSATPTSS